MKSVWNFFLILLSWVYIRAKAVLSFILWGGEGAECTESNSFLNHGTAVTIGTG